MHTHIYTMWCILLHFHIELDNYWVWKERSITYVLPSPKVICIIKCWLLVPVVSWASAADEAPGTLWMWGFWTHVQFLVSLSCPCSSWASWLTCVWEPTAPVRVKGCQWCWGTMSGRWRNRAQAHHCCVCTAQHPPLPRWHPFTVWRIIL